MSRVNTGVELFGDEQLDKFFKKSLRPNQQKQIILGAYRKLARPIIKDIKQNLKGSVNARRTGNLLKSIGTKATKRRNWSLLIGSRQYGSYKGSHGHLIDSGTTERYRRTSTGRRVSTGRVRATNFFKDATENRAGEIQNNYQNELRLSLDRFVNRNLARIRT